MTPKLPVEDLGIVSGIGTDMEEIHHAVSK